MTDLRACLADRHGATAIIAALAMTTMFGFIGLGVDVGLWYFRARTAQGAADSAALSAARAGTPANALHEARAIAAGYGIDGADIAVWLPPRGGRRRGDRHAVEVIISRPAPLLFAGGFITDPAPIHVRAVAATCDGQANGQSKGQGKALGKRASCAGAELVE